MLGAQHDNMIEMPIASRHVATDHERAMRDLTERVMLRINAAPDLTFKIEQAAISKESLRPLVKVVMLRAAMVDIFKR